jgi:ABC-type sugar transport system ATPase subunit
VFQEQALVPNISVAENLVLGQDDAFFNRGLIDRGTMNAIAQSIVDEAGVDIDVRRKSSSYNFSSRQSVEIARACLGPRILGGCQHPLVLLDEPTSALDRRDEENFFRLVNKIRQTGSVIFVSHRLSEVVEISDYIYVLKDGEIVAELKAEDANEEMLHGLMVGRERVEDHYEERRQQVITDQPVVFQVEGLESADEYHDINFEVRAGEIVGIGGLLESGKSALGKGIAGVDTPERGLVGLNGGRPIPPDIRRFVRDGLGYVPAERLVEGIISRQILNWNFSMASADIFAEHFGIWNRKAETEAAKDYIESFGIRSGSPKQIMGNLSGGNQQKVVLARWMQRNPTVLVLDNPTRGVDAGAKEEIYRLLRDMSEKGVGIVLITDELLELIGMSNRILIMQNGRIAVECEAPVENKPTERELVAAMLPPGSKVDDDSANAIASKEKKLSLESAQ